MSTPSFPVLPGQGWSVHKRPIFATRVASHASGREARMPFYAYPLYEFELTFDALASNSSHPALGVESLQSLMGLYLQCAGQYRAFLYTDPSDSVAVMQQIAVGDNTTREFTFVRTLGGFTEPVGSVLSVDNVYLNGVIATTGWAFTAPNILSFVMPPQNDIAISADFSFAYLCRFIDDQNDFENFLSGLWRIQSMKFRSVRS
jgi:hypothetical protein